MLTRLRQLLYQSLGRSHGIARGQERLIAVAGTAADDLACAL
jgi:hypothetical protein